MSLLQATNIEPSVSGAGDRGSAVVDLTEGLTITWQVNGSSPMTAYQVQIFKNDAASTYLYNTTKVTLATPFYGRNGLGEPQFFSFTIPASTLSSAGLSNGNEYKYILTQWWGATNAESITQSSADVFIARSKPVLTIAPIGTADTVTSRSYTFTASYLQAQGDNIESVRWELFTTVTFQGPSAISGTLYTPVLSWTYDGFHPTTKNLGYDIYILRCTVVTELGVEVTDEKQFGVDYRPDNARGVATACCAPGLPGAVMVTRPDFRRVSGTATGQGYTIQNGTLVLTGDGTTVQWNISSWYYKKSFTLFWYGDFAAADDNVFLTLGTDLQVSLGFSPNEIVFSSADGTILQRVSLPTIEVPNEVRSTLALAITPNHITWRLSYAYMTTTDPGTVYKTVVGDTELAFSLPTTFSSVVKLSGKQRCNFVYLKSKTLPPDAILGLFHDWFYIPDGWVHIGPFTPAYPKSSPEFDLGTLMLANFQHELEAGTIYSPLVVKEYTLYRRFKGNDAPLVYAGTTTTSTFYDYSVPNGVEQRWYIFAEATNGETVGPMSTEPLTIFFWDWIVIRAVEEEDGTYRATQVFRFGKNLSSGQIGNNNSPELLQNFTPYPTILPAPQNYRSGTLSSLIGVIDENGSYSDTIALRDAIYDLSLTTDTIFLKNRKGDLMQIVISGPITMETNDASASQAQKVGLPWAEVAPAEGVSIISTSAL